MIYMPQTFDELECVLQLVVDSYNFVAGQRLEVTELGMNEDEAWLCREYQRGASPAAAQICLSAKQNEPPPAQSALYFFSRLNK